MTFYEISNSVVTAVVFYICLAQNVLQTARNAGTIVGNCAAFLTAASLVSTTTVALALVRVTV